MHRCRALVDGEEGEREVLRLLAWSPRSVCDAGQQPFGRSTSPIAEHACPCHLREGRGGERSPGFAGQFESDPWLCAARARLSSTIALSAFPFAVIFSPCDCYDGGDHDGVGDAALALALGA